VSNRLAFDGILQVAGGHTDRVFKKVQENRKLNPPGMLLTNQAAAVAGGGIGDDGGRGGMA
jgi:hypothetical protein